MLIFVVAVCGILTMLAVRCPHSQLLFEYNYKWQLHGACIPLRRVAYSFSMNSTNDVSVAPPESAEAKRVRRLLVI